MRFFSTILVLILCLVHIEAALALQDAKTPQKPQETVRPLTNADVLEMLEGGLSQEIVIAKITTASCEFDTLPATLKALKANNVPEAVILAMIKAPTVSRKQEFGNVEPSAPGRINCNDDSMSFSAYTAPPNQYTLSGSDLAEVFRVKCGDRITLFNPSDKQAWVKIRTTDGRVGYISFVWVSREDPTPTPQEVHRSTESKKREDTQKANDRLEDCRAGAQNEYETKTSAVSNLALSPAVRVAAASKLRQNLDAELRECRSQYEMRLRAIDGE
jgi:hypothetical protein